jgi:hypothetical protein
VSLMALFDANVIMDYPNGHSMNMIHSPLIKPKKPCL